MIPQHLRRDIEIKMGERGAGPVTVRNAVSASGGCINQTALLQFSNGESAFLKWNSTAPSGMFTAEALGLRELRTASPLRVPEVYDVHESDGALPAYLLMEDLNRSAPVGSSNGNPPFDEELGRGLARQHQAGSRAFGFPSDNFIGPTPQPNTENESWVLFFRVHRLEHMLRLLGDNGIIAGAERKLFEPLLGRLDELLAPAALEPPALLHGDLWSGNVLPDGNGRPALIDPAAYYGNREADLAMMDLFGGFSARCRSSYQEVFPLLPGYNERRDIYNLYHILNHALLFGGGYLSQALSIARRWS